MRTPEPNELTTAGPKENPAEAVRRPAARLATAILMYSFGGLRREGGSEIGALPPGVTEAELLAACVGPDLDSTTALACLKELSPTSSNGCLYLHFDGARYCFKKDPNVTLLIEQEAEQVGRNDKQVRSRIKEMIETRLAGHRNAIVWPESAADIPDRDASFLVAYMPLEMSGKPRSQQETLAKDYLEKFGEKPRTFRNGVGLAIPTGDQVEILRRSVRYLIATEGVKVKAKQLNLTDEQRGQLRERESTEQAAAESALLKLYTEVWLPRAEDGGIGIEKVAAGGRPLQTTLSDKKHAMIHERIIELITSVLPRVFSSLAPNKIVELFRLGEGTPPALGVGTGEVVDGFYSFPGFTRLMTSGVIRKAITPRHPGGAFCLRHWPEAGPYARGKVRSRAGQDSIHGPCRGGRDRPGIRVPHGPTGRFRRRLRPLKPDRQPRRSRKKRRRRAGLARAEPGLHWRIQYTGGNTQTGSGSAVKPDLQKLVELNFATDRNGLFAAWNAVANLADMAGSWQFRYEPKATKASTRRNCRTAFWSHCAKRT